MPATTATTAPTARQLAFYNTLAAERGMPTIDAFAANLTRREASMAIDSMMQLPRLEAAAAANEIRRNSAGAEDMPTPNRNNRAGRMLAAGGIEATATLEDGQHVTVSIRTRTRSGRGWTNAALHEDGAITYVSILGRKVGWIRLFGDQYRLTLRTLREEYITAIRAVLSYAAGLNTGLTRVQEASRCGRCFRTLTDPVSIDRGIGPECFGRDTGSQHVAAEREANGEAATRVPRVTTGVIRDFPAANEVEISFTTTTDARVAPVARPQVQRMLNIVAEALDSYCDDEDRDFAMGVIKALARGEQSAQADSADTPF